MTTRIKANLLTRLSAQERDRLTGQPVLVVLGDYVVVPESDHRRGTWERGKDSQWHAYISEFDDWPEFPERQESVKPVLIYVCLPWMYRGGIDPFYQAGDLEKYGASKLAEILYNRRSQERLKSCCDKSGYDNE